MEQSRLVFDPERFVDDAGERAAAVGPGVIYTHFPSVALPTESGSSQERPDICIGTDPFHTPPYLVAQLREVFVDEGFSVAIDSPFEGTLVPGTSSPVRL